MLSSFFLPSPTTTMMMVIFFFLLVLSTAWAFYPPTGPSSEQQRQRHFTTTTTFTTSYPSPSLLLLSSSSSSPSPPHSSVSDSFLQHHPKGRQEPPEPQPFQQQGQGQEQQQRRRQVLGQMAASTSAAWMAAAATATASTTSSNTNPSPVWASTTTTAMSTPLPAVKIPQIQLGKGTLSVSRTIQGYWQLAGGHGRYKESDALANMKAHYQAGINTMDTADIYGPSERVVGQFVAAQQQQSSQSAVLPPAVPCTKFCCFRFLYDIDRAEVKQRIRQQCERLQVPSLPLVQFFWSDYDIKRYVDVALYLTELKEEGLIQEIGATNFDLPRLQELKKAGVPLVSHQVQLSALDRRPVQSGMADWCQDNDISLIAFGTVASGILSNQYLGRRNEPLTAEESRITASMRLYTATAKRFGPWSLVQELLETMQVIAQQVRDDGRCPTATVANIAQRHVLQTPAVASVLIGVRNQEHLVENVQTHSFSLNDDEINVIDKVIAKRSGPKGDVWQIERGMI